MPASTASKRALLQGLFWDSEDQSISLKDAIKAALRGKLKETSTGKIVTAVSGNGRQIQFMVPQLLKTVTPMDLMETYSDFMIRYDRAVLALTGTPTDQEIYDEMLDKLVAVRSFTHDLSRIR